MRSLNQLELRVSAQLGEDIHAIQARSTYPLTILRAETTHPILMARGSGDKSVHFEYSDSVYGFELASIALVWIEFKQQRAVEIQLNPHDNALNLMDSIHLMKSLCCLLDRSGWLPADKNHHALIAQLPSISKESDERAFIIQTWRAKYKTIMLKLSCASNEEDLPPSLPYKSRLPKYIITLVMSENHYN